MFSEKTVKEPLLRTGDKFYMLGCKNPFTVKDMIRDLESDSYTCIVEESRIIKDETAYRMAELQIAEYKAGLRSEEYLCRSTASSINVYEEEKKIPWYKRIFKNKKEMI